MQCIYEDGKSEHRVCIFYNIVLWDGQLLYLADGKFAAFVTMNKDSKGKHDCHLM